MIHPDFHDMEPIMQDLYTGNIQALQFIVDQYYPTLCYFANRLTDDPSMAETIAEESIARLWKSRQQMPDAKAVVVFLFTHARDASFACMKNLQPGIKEEEAWQAIWNETSQYIQCEMIRAEVIRKLCYSIHQP